MRTAINSNTTLITPNRRLSATLLKKYNQEQINSGKTCWESFDILPYTSWVQRLWREYSSSQTIEHFPVLLTMQQELVLWEEILQKYPANEALLQLSETAELAKSAWDILKQWRIELSHPVLKTTDDSAIFLLWAAEFQKKCVENSWLDTHSLIELICEKIQTHQIKPPDCLVLAGFTELSPLQKHLFACCEQVGTQIIIDDDSPTAELTQRISLADEEAEIRTMAHWAKSLIDHNASLKIGCVIPNLEKKRDTISAIFSEIFCEGQLYSLDCTTQPFNITAGKSLASYPIIRAALQLLGLNTNAMTSDAITQLLLSPFLGDAEYEHIKRAQFDARLHHANISSKSLAQLLNTQEKINLYASCPRLAKRLENYLNLLQQQSNLLSMSEWAEVFVEALGLLGWPGERSINSQEYQIVQRWLELFADYKAYDSLLAKKNYQDALHYLTRLTSNVIFQPQGTDASVQILGVLEATALPFDHTWVMGFDDNAWPPAAKPNPFIPRPLQTSLKMPHSSAEHEFEYSKRLTEQLIASTQHIIFSHAKTDAGCELRTSPLIVDLTEINLEQLQLSRFTPLNELCRNSQLLETQEDTQAPVVDVENMRGGAALFKLQAACPFKAFAEIRLHAKPLEAVTMGLRAQDRGKITHKALELIWSEIKTSENLKNYTESELNELLTRAIKEAMQHEKLASRYLSLEVERLQNLLWNWLEIEKSRPDFTVVAQEEERTINIANLLIRLRIDRIDQLQDGSHLIIDYKTGKNNQVKYWFGDRMEEPQLPLYCISTETAVDCIAFAEINPEALGLKGISKKHININAIKPLSDTNYSEGRAWDQQILNWKMILEKIGNEFANGHAAVDPKIESETCTYCQLQALCRINESI